MLEIFWKNRFWYFLEILSLVFPDFLHKDCVLGMPKTWPSPIFLEKNMLEVAIFPDFHWSQYCDIFLLIIDSNPQYFLKVAGTTDCRAEKRAFFNFSSCTRFINFCSIRSLAFSFVLSLIRSFVFQNLFHQCLYLLSFV